MRMNRKKKLITVIGLTGAMMALCTGCGKQETGNTAKITLAEDNISIDGTGATSDGNIVTITSGGQYEISGTLLEGQIQINTKNESDKVELVLAGVELSNGKECAIYEKQAGQVTITLAKDSDNVISSGEESMYEKALEEAKESNSIVENSETTESENATANPEETPSSEGTEIAQEVATTTKAAIYAKDALTVSGEGNLKVNGYLNNGIQSKKDLEILSGTITVTASNDGIKSGANLEVSDGTVTTTTVGDGIDASENMTVSNGIFTIKTGDGAGEVKNMGNIMPDMKKNEETASDTDTTKKDSTKETATIEKDTEDKTDETTQEQQFKDRKFGGGRHDFAQQDSTEDSGVSQKGIKSGMTLTIDGGSFAFDTTDDSIHSNDVVVVNNGNIEIATGDDGIHADNSLTINDGNINITQAYEGLEATEIVINNGDIDVTSSDDGINAGGGDSGFNMGGFGKQEENSDADSAQTETTDTEETVDPVITIKGGDIYVNADGDGIDSNGSIYITGGNVYVDGPANSGNSAIDIGTENNGICQITGGTVVGIGYSGMAEAMDSSSTQYSLLYAFDSEVSEGTEIVITDEDGKEVASVTTVKSCDSIIYSSKELTQGATYTITAGDQSGELTLDESYTTNATSSGRGGGHGGPKDWNRTEQGTADGSDQNGERPEMPNGEEPNGERPEMPSGEDQSGNASENSENESINNNTEV